MLFYFVLFLFDFFSKTIIVISHKTLAHFKIWDYDFLMQMKPFSQIALPWSLTYYSGYSALTTEQHLQSLLPPFLEDLSSLNFHYTPLLFLVSRIAFWILMITVMLVTTITTTTYILCYRLLISMHVIG